MYLLAHKKVTHKKHYIPQTLPGALMPTMENPNSSIILNNNYISNCACTKIITHNNVYISTD